MLNMQQKVSELKQKKKKQTKSTIRRSFLTASFFTYEKCYLNENKRANVIWERKEKAGGKKPSVRGTQSAKRKIMQKHIANNVQIRVTEYFHTTGLFKYEIAILMNTT